MRRCDGVNRREFLQVGALAGLGLGLAHPGARRGKAVNAILIWLDGGPSHLDTWDLKPDAPIEVRGEMRPADTNVPGMRICEHFRTLARHMDKVCLVRSVTSELGEHNLGSHYVLTGYKPSPVLEYPSYGSVLATMRKNEGALPPYVAVPSSVAYAGNGFLPPAARPFATGGDPSQPDFQVRDLDSGFGLDVARLQRRRSFLQDFERLGQQIEQSAVRESRDAQFEQAYRLLFSPAAKQAFELGREPNAVRQKYGAHKLGQSCLLARRLIEAGCSFVTVTDPGWDTHAQIYRELKEGFVGGSAGKIPKLDQALGALLADLSDRGLLKETLVLVLGEFGRTPKLNSAAGRDHWPRVFSVLLAGAGVRGGQVVGASDARGESPAEQPVTPADLARTIYTLLGLDPDHELKTADGRPVKIASGEVIQACLA